MNRIAILYFLLIFGCGGGFDPDTKGPVVNLVYPHEGYVVSDSVLIIYETEDDAQVLSMELHIEMELDGLISPISILRDTQQSGIFSYWYLVLDKQPQSIKIKGVAEDEFGNLGESQEIEIFIDNDIRFVKISSEDSFINSDGNEINIPYDYEVMTFPVTVRQYISFLNSANELGHLWVSSGLVKGTYSDPNWPVGIYPFLDLGGNYYGYNAGGIDWDGTNFFIMDTLYANHPVTQVTWFGAQAFSNFYQMRLPNINEWEKVASGNEGNIYPWGNSISPSNANYYNSDDPFEIGTTPVGYYGNQNYCELNAGTWENEECNYNGFITFNSASEFDVYDLGGNVWEWTNTISPNLHVNDPKSYIQKGGSFLNIGTSQAITNNNYSYPEIGLINFGFRCVRN